MRYFSRFTEGTFQPLQPEELCNHCSEDILTPLWPSEQTESGPHRDGTTHTHTHTHTEDSHQLNHKSFLFVSQWMQSKLQHGAEATEWDRLNLETILPQQAELLTSNYSETKEKVWVTFSHLVDSRGSTQTVTAASLQLQYLQPNSKNSTVVTGSAARFVRLTQETDGLVWHLMCDGK